MKLYVLYHAELGVYLEQLETDRDTIKTVWMKPPPEREFDPTFAATFKSPEAIAEHIATWKGPPPPGWRVVEVDADGAGYATLAACAAAGIPVATVEEMGSSWQDALIAFEPGGESERGPQWAQHAAVLSGD